MNESTDKHLENLAAVRQIMERSSRVISLSGLSGIWAGITAIVSSMIAYVYMNEQGLTHEEGKMLPLFIPTSQNIKVLIIIACITIIVAIGGAVFFTAQSARKRNLPVWDKQAARLLFSLMVPLAAGGIFCLLLIRQGYIDIIAPATLVFYGLALLNASRFTVDEMKILGLLQIVLGLFAAWQIGYGLLFWAMGFGVLHIVYGTRMYFKYERRAVEK